MVHNKFNMVDFKGFDLVKDFGKPLPGIYDAIIEANWNCVYIMVYGLRFSEIPIAPTYMTPEISNDEIILNGSIRIYRNDTIALDFSGAAEELLVSDNGTYISQGIYGYNPVIVQVPTPYCKVHFMIDDVEVYSELAEYGSLVSHIAVLNSIFYYAEASADLVDTYVSMEPAQTPYSAVQITLNVSSYSKEGSNLRIISLSGTGIILSAAVRTTLRGRWIRANYRQVGNCTNSARFPGVVTSGSGRGSFDTPAINTDFSITNTNTYPNFFIGYVDGYSELLIYNFFSISGFVST